MIGLKNVAPLSNQSEPKPIVACSHTFSRASGTGYMYLLRVLIGSLVLSVSVLIGWIDYFGFGFTTLN